jgi:type IV pilus assembly protein PilY1
MIHRLHIPQALTAVALLFLPLMPAAHAATDISSVPLASSADTAAAPNFMFILDDSGSMAGDFLPGAVNDNNTCKRRNDNSDACQAGDPPYFAAQFNTIAYNPGIRYPEALKFDGTGMGNQSNPTSVKVDPFTSTSTISLVTDYPERVHCKNSGDSPTDPVNCRRNGLNGSTPMQFAYPVDTNSNLSVGAPINVSNPSYPDSTYKYPKTRYGAAHYFTISPKEYCSDPNLVDCTLTAATTGSFTYPAPVRWCQSNSTNKGANDSAAVSGISGSSPRCQAKYDTNHIYPRYGIFSRVDIVSTTPSYPKAPSRTDCAGGTCTYLEEITNFGNWYAYYRTRMKMMKSAAGRAFADLDNRYRVGFVTINPGNPVDSNKYLKISEFEPSHKQDWYETFYKQTPGSGTPLREALSRVGRHFAGKKDGINQGMDNDPIQYSCQQNFALLTTDGYWNGNAGQILNGGAIGNQDNQDLTTDPKWSSRGSGTYDGGVSGASDTLADVALYYYKTDLRPNGSIGALGADVSKPNVPTSPKDFNPEQHLTTFTLGIVDGVMTYRPDYEVATAGDFYKIRTSSSGCSWASGTCNWPLPASNSSSALDDLWHAAVNGRGKFYLAQDPNALSDGLADAIAAVKTRVASAAASATSSPNITPTEKSIYSSTYTTVEWSGEIAAQDIDPATGTVISGIKWSAQALLDKRVGPTSDSRKIYMRDPGGSNGLKDFVYGSMTSTERTWFDNKCVPASNLSQCDDLTVTELGEANKGDNLVRFLRGQTAFVGTVYRNRLHALGDTVNSKPVYVRAPLWGFADAVVPDYATFKASKASRQAALYVSANDGMLHAFNADSGEELWAYVPRIIMPGMYKLADLNYSTQHQYFVDGWIETMDAFDGSQWRTILVGGLNSGGRGYYALDITDPNAPKSMWEFCSDGSLCAEADSDLGLTYGNPIITKRAFDGKWVVLVTSGYNNISPGTGEGFLYVLDAFNGKVLEKVGTGAGDTAMPSGLARIQAWADDFYSNNTATYVYGGDLRGNFFGFNTKFLKPKLQKLATLVDGTGRPQSVTTRPELAYVDGNRMIYVGTGRYLGVSDLQDPATWIPASTDAYQQSLYAFKDKETEYTNLRASLVQQTILPLTATTRTSTANEVDLTAVDGWFVDFNPGNQSPGERVNIDPQLALGTLLVITNVPTKDACSLGGDSWAYQFDYLSGTYVSTAPSKMVAQKLTSAITVGVVVFRLPDGQLKAVATDAAAEKTTFGVNTGTGAISGRRTSWRELIR